MSVPEALATTIRISLMFSIALAHQRGAVARVRRAPLGDGSREPLGIPGYPWVPMGAPGEGTRPEFRNPNNNPIIVSILPGGAELIRDGGEGGPSHSAKRGIFNKKRQLGGIPPIKSHAREGGM